MFYDFIHTNNIHRCPGLSGCTEFDPRPGHNLVLCVNSLIKKCGLLYECRNFTGVLTSSQRLQTSKSQIYRGFYKSVKNDQQLGEDFAKLVEGTRKSDKMAYIFKSVFGPEAGGVSDFYEHIQNQRDRNIKIIPNSEIWP